MWSRYTHNIPQVKQAMFSRSFGGEIPLAILFPSAALSLNPCVHSLSIVGAEERTPLRSSPILRPPAPLTLQLALQKQISALRGLLCTHVLVKIRNHISKWYDFGERGCLQNLSKGKWHWKLKKEKKIITQIGFHWKLPKRVKEGYGHLWKNVSNMWRTLYLRILILCTQSTGFVPQNQTFFLRSLAVRIHSDFWILTSQNQKKQK